MAEKEYIDRKALLKDLLELPPKMDELGYGWLGRRGVWQMVADYPAADVVEVVRCRECFYRELNDANIPVCTGIMSYFSTPDDWYCPCGKRKEENHG